MWVDLLGGCLGRVKHCFLGIGVPFSSPMLLCTPRVPGFFPSWLVDLLTCYKKKHMRE